MLVPSSAGGHASLVYDETEERSEDISAELAENIQQAVEGLQVNVWL